MMELAVSAFGNGWGLLTLAEAIQNLQVKGWMVTDNLEGGEALVGSAYKLDQPTFGGLSVRTGLLLQLLVGLDVAVEPKGPSGRIVFLEVTRHRGHQTVDDLAAGVGEDPGGVGQPGTMRIRGLKVHRQYP